MILFTLDLHWSWGADGFKIGHYRLVRKGIEFHEYLTKVCGLNVVTLSDEDQVRACLLVVLATTPEMMLEHIASWL